MRLTQLSSDTNAAIEELHALDPRWNLAALGFAGLWALAAWAGVQIYRSYWRFLLDLGAFIARALAGPGGGHLPLALRADPETPRGPVEGRPGSRSGPPARA